MPSTVLTLLFSLILFRTSLAHSSIVEEPKLPKNDKTPVEDLPIAPIPESFSKTTYRGRYYWKNTLKLGGQNISVYNEVGKFIYNISDQIGDRKIKHGFVITNSTGHEILEAADTHKGVCNRHFTYNDNIGDSFTISPRGGLPDRWLLNFPKGKGDQAFKYSYHRARYHFTGTAYGANKSIAAQILRVNGKDAPPSIREALGNEKALVALYHDTDDVEPFRFIALSVLVQKRIKRCRL